MNIQYSHDLCIQEILRVKSSSLMLTALHISTWTSSTITSQDTSVGVFRHSTFLVAVGSKQTTGIFLAIVSTHRQEETPSVEWQNLECVDQGRLEW